MRMYYMSYVLLLYIYSMYYAVCTICPMYYIYSMYYAVCTIVQTVPCTVLCTICTMHYVHVYDLFVSTLNYCLQIS